MDHSDKRSGIRRELSHTARVATGISAPLECRMTDVSFTGARLLVHDSSSVPQQFMLLLNDKLSRWCDVVWRADKAVGVKFAAPPKTLIKRPQPNAQQAVAAQSSAA